VVWCGSKIGSQKDMFKKEIGLRVQDMLAILGSIVNIRVKVNLSDHLMSTKIWTLIMKKIFI
jgi:hypothetical protein